MKIKFPEYVRLHKLVTGLSEIAIWEHIKNGGKVEKLIENVPDEFMFWVREVAGELRSAFLYIESEARRVAEHASQSNSRKEQAEIITKSKYPGISFAMLDGKEYNEMIYKLIRPKGKSSFKIDTDA